MSLALKESAVVILSVFLGLLFVFANLTFLYQFLIDLIVVGVIASVLRLRIYEASRKRTIALIVLFLLLASSAGAYYGVY